MNEERMHPENSFPGKKSSPFRVGFIALVGVAAATGVRAEHLPPAVERPSALEDVVFDTKQAIPGTGIRINAYLKTETGDPFRRESGFSARAETRYGGRIEIKVIEHQEWRMKSYVGAEAEREEGRIRLPFGLDAKIKATSFKIRSKTEW